MAVRKPRKNSAGKPHSQQTDGPKDVLKLERQNLLIFMLIFPLILAGYGFYLKQDEGPIWPVALHEPTERGSILARDGTVFAEGGNNYRRYPQGLLASHVIGFSGKLQATGNYGLEGIEYTQDSLLQSGNDVVLTLDPHLQAIAQRHLRQKVEELQAENGSVVMLEAATGRILTVANYPEFDPNYPSRAQTDHLLNKAFLHQYEPGSVMKPFTIAALLEEGKLHVEEAIEAPMALRVGSKTFRDVVQHDPILNAWGILKFSSNSGMLNLTKRFSDEELYAWFRHFGFSQDVGVPSVFTRPGQLRQPKWVPQDQASITIGQSMSTTALQLAAIYSIFANDGLYVTPYLIEGDTVPLPKQLISQETALKMRELLANVVARNDIMRPAMAPGVTVAGKTGTADIFDTELGEYIDDEYSLTFAGMFPVDKPKITMVVTLQKPQLEKRSTLVVAPLFGEIQTEVVALWQTAPSTTVVAESQ